VKILFSSWPGYGHLLPMVPLARAAMRDGHQVLVSSGSDLTGLIDRHGLPAHAAGPTLAESYRAAAEANRAAGLSELFGRMDPQLQAVASARNLFGASAVHRGRDLALLVDRWRPDLVVHDVLELGAASAAEQAGIPHATHSYGPLVPFTGAIAPVLGAVLGEAGLPDPITAVFASAYLDVCPPGLQPAGTDPWTDVIPVRPSAGDVPAGESLPAAFADLPHPTTVYLTLGTVTNEQPEVFRAVLDGCARHPVNVVVTTGPGVDPAAVVGDRPNVLALPYLSQALVLPHCAAVVSHCGAGTMFGALCFGLPQLCLPQGTDQPFNADAVARAGAGEVLTPDQVTVDAVDRALERVLRDPAVRAAAGRLRAEIDDRPTPREALRVLLDRI
jgi:UDP:flavonoid glycosyltransferase YjiC (YdhE family)